MFKRIGAPVGSKNLGHGKAVGALKSNDKTVITKAVMKAVLQTTVEISDVFPPLKSVVVGLNIIIDYTEKTGINQTDLENLIGRITRIKETFVVPIDDDDSNHAKSLNNLTKELETISGTLEPLQHQSRFKRIFMSSDNATIIQDYIVKVERALGDYQLSLLQDLYKEHISQDERTTLDRLPRAKDAGFEASHDRPNCLTGTRVEILHTLRRWAFDSDARQVYWLNGHAGSGKSTIAQSFAEWLSAQHKLGASFFCSRESNIRSDYKTIFPTLAYQLGQPSHLASSRYRKALLRALKKNPDIASLTLQNQLEELIVKPVVDSDLTTILVIDALDECRDSNSTSIILSFLAEVISRIPSLKFFITSRPETHIQSGFRLGQIRPITDVMILQEVGAESVEGDIRLFFRERLTSIARLRTDVDIPKDWPNKRDIDVLTTKAAGLFILASTAVKFIHAKHYDPADRLRMLLRNNTVYEGSAGLNKLYLRILEDAFSDDVEEFLGTFRSVLGLMVVSHDVLRIATIAEILDVPSSDVKTSLRFLHSVLVAPDDPMKHVHFLHKSFPDFLTDPQRCTDMRFFIDTDSHHLRAARRCLELMSSGLRKNMCSLPQYSMNEDLSPAQKDQCIGDTLKYSCRYWANHLLACNTRNVHFEATKPVLRHFVTTQQHIWFEVLALIGELQRAVESLDRLHDWLLSHGEPPDILVESIKDGQRFVLFAFDGIRQSAAHIYHSAIPLSPHDPLLKRVALPPNSFTEAEVVIGAGNSWSSDSRTIQMANWVHSLEYSHDGTLFAASGNHFSHLLRSGTGERLAEFDTSQSEWVRSLSFSLDDRILATAPDKWVRLWDVRTGHLLAELPEHHDFVVKVAFHPMIDHSLLTVDECGRVGLWDVSAEEPTCRVSFSAQSSNGKSCWLQRYSETTLLLGTRSGCVEEWSVGSTPVRLTQFRSAISSQSVAALASSSDGSLIASALNNIIVIYDANDASIRSSVTIQDTGTLLSLRFSPSNLARVVSFGALFGMGLYYPEREKDRVVQLPGHSDFVRCADFSPDGRFIASGSDDKTVKVWEVRSEDADFGKDDRHHTSSIRCAHFSLDGQLVVSASVDHTVRVWSALDGTLLGTLKGYHHNWVYAATFLPDSAYVISRDVRGVMVIWDWKRNKVIYNSTALYDEYGRFQRDFPFTYQGALGFISTNEIEGKCSLWCWSVEIDDVDGVNLRLMSQGTLPRGAKTDARDQYAILRIYHAIPSVSSPTLTLVVECASGAKFIAPWTHFDIPVDPPETLSFIEDTERHSEVVSAFDQPSFIGEEKVARQSSGNDWILGDSGGRRILWVPPAHRGFGRWYQKKLLLQGTSGRLTLVDFSRVRMDDNQLF